LARYLASILDHQNIDVRHFHQWGSENHISFRGNEGNDEYGERLLARLQCGEGNALQYDAVLIDEAQDFCRAWFMCAKLALKEPDDGDLIIVGDGGQSVYRRRPFTWADAGIHAVGRTINLKFDLNTNYRNTRQILAAAHTFARTPDANTKDADLSIAVLPDKSMRTGITPRMFDATDRGEEIELIAQLVSAWIEDGIAINGVSIRLNPSDIGILYPRLRRNEESSLARLRTMLSPFRTVRLSGKGADGDARDPGVKLTTIHSAKGLQFKAVILMWADLLPSKLPDRVEAEERSLFYIGLTRAEDVLVVTHCGPSAYVDEMRESLARIADEGNGG
jgi:superfamily I DNA/RNA helicase